VTERFDFAVVGSGAGGSAVAARLAEGGAKVLLVEQGAPAKVEADARRAVRKYYTNEGLSAATGNCLLPIPTGTTLGGTTKINSGTCLRTPSDLLTKWEAVDGFDAADFERHLDEAWRRLKVKRVPEERLSASTRLFFKGLDALKIAGAEPLDRGEDGCVGSGRCCFVCPRDAKMSADKAFLAPLKDSASLEVACETTLETLERGAGEVRLGLKPHARPRRTVSCRAAVLACGSLRTPYFVRKFRLGPAPSSAGDGLSVHPAAKVWALFDQPTGDWTGVPQGGGLLDPQEPRIRYEGIHVPPEMAAMTIPLEGRALRGWMDRLDSTASFGFMIRDASRGSVRYPGGPALPFIRYEMSGEDLSLMVRAMRFAGLAFLAAGAKAVALPFNRPGNVFLSAGELERADLGSVRARDLQMMAFHPLGTCGLGRVVDGNLKLCDGVYAADGSVVPESLGVNPQITIYAFALRLAEHLLGRKTDAR
jgi:choline dehydrogenase-like flavoprotein